MSLLYLCSVLVTVMTIFIASRIYPFSSVGSDKRLMAEEKLNGIQVIALKEKVQDGINRSKFKHNSIFLLAVIPVLNILVAFALIAYMLCSTEALGRLLDYLMKDI